MDQDIESPTNFELNRAKIRRAIDVQSRFSQQYLLMNTLATIVAAYGLFTNSSAVVIGAMIIALLLGPIMGLALAMVDGDEALLQRSLTAEFVGAALVLTIGFIIGKIHYNLPMTTEILSRTQPTILDLMIALAGGAAGAYATISPRVSAGLVGVAISTALVPPLTASGILLSHGLLSQAAGAFLLFATNLVAIQVASSIVLLAFGFRKVTVRDPDEKGFIRRVAIDLALILGLGIFLYIQLSTTILRHNFEEEVKTYLTKALKPIPGAYLAETRFVDQGDTQVIVAVVRTPNSLSPEKTAEIEKQLPRFKKANNELHIRSLITKETISSGYLHEIDPTAPPIERIDEHNSPIQSDLNDENLEPQPVLPAPVTSDGSQSEILPSPLNPHNSTDPQKSNEQPPNDQLPKNP